MSRGLGSLQTKLLAALRERSGPVDLQSLAALAAGLSAPLDAPQGPSRAVRHPTYTATSRAIRALERRGLVSTEIEGFGRGEIVWVGDGPGSARPVWRFRHPGKRLSVALRVDSLQGGDSRLSQGEE